MKQSIQLSDHFGYGRLLRFTIPSILMMIFSAPDCHVPGSGGRDAGALPAQPWHPLWDRLSEELCRSSTSSERTAAVCRSASQNGMAERSFVPAPTACQSL